MLSLVPGETLTACRRAALEQLVAQELAAQGTLHIGKDSGLLEAS